MLIFITVTIQIILMLFFFFLLIRFPLKYKKEVWETNYSIYLSSVACAINILNIIMIILKNQ